MLTNLKRLDLGERRFEAGASLSQLSTLRDLRALCLAKCYFMEGGAMQVAGLANLPSLTALDISCWCGVNEAVCAAVTCISSLVHLNVSGTAVTDEGLEELVGMRHLRSLDASYCMEVRGYSLARDLNPTSSLTILNLCECKKVSDARLRFSLRHSPASMDGQQAALQPPWAARFPALAGSRLCAVSLRGCHQLARTHLHR